MKHESRVGLHDVVEHHEMPGCFGTIADVEWLQGYLQSLQPTISTDSCADLWKQLELALGGEQRTAPIICPTGAIACY